MCVLCIGELRAVSPIDNAGQKEEKMVMNARRLVLDAVAGIILAVAVMLVVRYIVRDVYTAIAPGDDAGARLAMLWLRLCSVALGVIAVAIRKDPLTCGLAGILVFAVYAPFLVNLTVPSWYPDWLTSAVLVSLPSAPFIVAGVLIGAAGWNAFELVRPNKQAG
jgi:hypothetical protein